MKITGIELFEENIPLKQPFITARRRIDVIKDYVLRISTDEGVYGYGACAPTPVITGDTVGSIACAVKDFIEPLLVGQTVSAELLPMVQSVLFHNTSPKAAADIAIYDLLAKEKGVPLFVYLGGKNEDKCVKTDATVSLSTPEAMVAEAREHLNAGFSALKVKLGGGRMADVERLEKLRDVICGETVLRLDANQGWSVEDAVYISEAAEQMGYNIELIEQPVHYTDLEGMAEVTRRCPFRILADESVFSSADAGRLIRMGACDMINIKLMKCGGIYEGMRIQRLAAEHGIECMLGCMMEGGVSVTAAAHFGAAVGITCYDLDPPYLVHKMPGEGSTVFEGDNILLSKEGIGLGYTKII
ncbi:MAG: dipeptide epimerase [Clostridia bacterium]|nr:dipeptide epimerase [Clostridia bacterium]